MPSEQVPASTPPQDSASRAAAEYVVEAVAIFVSLWAASEVFVDRAATAVPDAFYAAASGVIPVVLLAVVFESRERKSGGAGRAIFILSAALSEGAALYALASSKSSALLLASVLYGLVLNFALLLWVPALGEAFPWRNLFRRSSLGAFGVGAVAFAAGFSLGAREQVVVVLDNTDDVAQVFVNCERKGFAEFAQPRRIDLGPLRKSDRITIAVYNEAGGYAWGMTLISDGRVRYVRREGEVGKKGARDNDQKRKNQYVFQITTDRDGNPKPHCKLPASGFA